MKVLITGAHFTPAVAVINELKKQKDIEVVYVGRTTTMEGDNTPSVESQVLPEMGVRFIPITAGRLQREFSLYTVPSLLKIPIGFIQAFLIVLKEKPDVILSFGGYVAVPVVLVGWLFSVPIIVHEQTLVTGLANKISGFFADKIAISFKTNNSFNKQKTILTGNPIREEVLSPSRKLPQEFKKIFDTAKNSRLPLILIMGGNQGSHIINTVVEECLNKLKKISYVIHAAGDNKFNDFERLKSQENDRYLIRKWIGKEYGYILSKVDLVVCRAGINTLTEIAYMGKPALVIPIPYLYQDEQNKNAKFFEEWGLVRILSQSKLTSQTLLAKLKQMLNALKQFKQKAKKAKSVIIPDAAKRLALETTLLVKS